MLTELFTELQVRLGDGVQVVDAQAADKLAKPPRVRWTPLTSRINPVRRAGGAGGDDGPIAERWWTVEIEIWGADFTATLALADLVRAHLHDISTHFTVPSEGLETWDFGGTAAKGVEVLAQLTIITPVLRTPLPTITITDPEDVNANVTITPQEAES